MQNVNLSYTDMKALVACVVGLPLLQCLQVEASPDGGGDSGVEWRFSTRYNALRRFLLEIKVARPEVAP